VDVYSASSSPEQCVWALERRTLKQQVARSIFSHCVTSPHKFSTHVLPLLVTVIRYCTTDNAGKPTVGLACDTGYASLTRLRGSVSV